MRRCVSRSPGKLEWGCAECFVITHTHIHTEIAGLQKPPVCQGYEIICVHTPFNTILFCFFASIQAETRLEKDKNRTLLTSPSSPLSPVLSRLYSPALFLSISSLHSDVVAAVLLQLSNACALGQARGCLGVEASRIFTLPSGKCAFHQHKTCSEQSKYTET